MDGSDPRCFSTEEELVERFRSTRDNRYFDALYLASRRKVIGVCFRLVGRPDAAEELAADAFLRAYQQFSTMEGNRFTAWVCRIAANLALNRIRNEKTGDRILSSELRLPDRAESDPVEAQIVRSEEGGIARKIVESLAPEQQKVLLLRYVDGCSYREIEEITGFDSGQVRSYLQNARRNFQLRWLAKMSVRTGGKDGT